MKKGCTPLFLNLLMLTLLAIPSVAQQSHHYHFNNNFAESNSAAPDLNVLGTGAFINEGLQELSCIARPVYGFTQNSGIQYDNGAAGNFLGESYSVEMYFQFLSNSGYRRIIDFKDQASDSGLYCNMNQLYFYDILIVNTTAFIANQYVYFALTRDSVTDEVNMYIDGVLAGSFIDSTNQTLLNASNVLNFFRDDLVFGGEAHPGRIAWLGLHNYELDASQVNANYSDLETMFNVLSFVPDVNSACLTGNVFNFTNTSENAGGYTYEWDFGDGNTFTGTNASHSYASPGIYTVQLIADNGIDCADTVSVQVEVLTTAPVSLGPDAEICDGDTLTLDAGSGFVSYSWNTGATSQTMQVSVSGPYIVEVTDSVGCIGTDTIQVSVLSYPLLELGTDTTVCFGESVVLVATPGLSTYLWSTGETTDSISVTGTGWYSVTVANSAGCSVTDSVSVTVLPEVLITLGADTAFCEGNTLTLDPGLGFITYIWSDGSILPTLDVTTSGTYAVSVTDMSGCVAYDTINVVVNANPVISLGADSSFCGGTSVLLDPGTFVGYLWNDGSQNPTLSVTTTGTYSVIVTDASGCTGTDSVTLTATPLVNLGPDQEWCTGLSVVLDAGGTNVTYLWNDGSTTQTLFVDSSGTYTVTVTDMGGCVNSDEITVSFNDPPVIDLGPDFDICDGEIALLDPGQGYSGYLWSDGSTASQLLVTTAGTYTVTVSSAPNCDATDFITIGVLPLPNIELGSDTALCDGSVLTLDAGAGFDTYLWSDGSSGQTLNVTVTGLYAVTITDVTGCENTDSILVTFEGPPFIELGPDQSICSGTATVLDAGSGMSSYLWSDGSTSQMLLVGTAGTYSVTITSMAGCTAQDSITITVFNSPSVSLGPDTTLCDGASLLLDAGAGFNSYLWNDGSFAQTLTVNTPGIYTVLVTDANNCNATDDIEVLYHAPVPTPSITQLGNTLQSSASSGNQWYANPGGLIPGATGSTYDPGMNGTFYVIVTDSNGCVSAPSPDFIFLFDGLPTISNAHFDLMPNPASGSVTINTQGWDVPFVDFELIDMLGKTVWTLEAAPTGKFRLNVSGYPEGVYFVRVTSDKYHGLKRLIINR